MGLHARSGKNHPSQKLKPITNLCAKYLSRQKKDTHGSRLWQLLEEKWSKTRSKLTIAELVSMATKEDAGIQHNASYEYAMLSILGSNRKQQYVRHLDNTAAKIINAELSKPSRNNTIWRRFIECEVEMANKP